MIVRLNKELRNSWLKLKEILKIFLFNTYEISFPIFSATFINLINKITMVWAFITGNFKLNPQRFPKSLQSISLLSVSVI